MKALILKDFYVLWKQMRLIVLILVGMSVVGGAFNSIFVVIWCSMLPYTAIAYDERSHWNHLAAMMPYSRQNLVLSKYVLGWLCMAASAVVSLALQAAVSLFGHGGPELSSMLVSIFVGLISLAVTMPLIFHFGVERGRMIFMIVIFGVAIAGGIAADIMEEIRFLSLPLMSLLFLAAVVVTVISIPLSMKFYNQAS